MMRGRSRRSATNFIEVAMLEITVLASFVLIAQPQLRQALLEIFEPTSAAPYGQTSPALDVQPTQIGYWSTGLENSAPSRGVEHVALYAPAPATQLYAGEWNIAAATQSPRAGGGWLPTQSIPSASLQRDTPPYGTQSPWK